MSRPMTITIPDELALRLDPYRDHVNMSRICAQALEREVSILEAMSHNVSQLSELVQRIKLQKDEAEQESHTLGFQDGIRAASRADYADFRLAEALRGSPKPYPLPELGEAEFEERRDDFYAGGEPFDFMAYRYGWLDGLLAVWRQIEEKL